MRSVNGIKIASQSNNKHVSNEFALFDLNSIRLGFGKLTKHSNILRQHEALQDADVPETTLCVTSGALQF